MPIEQAIALGSIKESLSEIAKSLTSIQIVVITYLTIKMFISFLDTFKKEEK